MEIEKIKMYSLHDIKLAITAAWTLSQSQNNNLTEQMDLIIKALTVEVVTIGDHSYRTSSEDMVLGDWVVTDKDKVVQVDNEEYFHRANCKKIVATTNDDLRITTDYRGRYETREDKICYNERLPKID